MTTNERPALAMIREAIEELFGPIASLESEEAVLLRGPEPVHEAEAIVEALQRVADSMKTKEAQRSAADSHSQPPRSEMTSMREKIARRLYEATPFKETEGGYDQQSPTYQRMCLLLADAALDALMEPTEGMVSAVRDGHDFYLSWQQMLQAARGGA